MSLRVGIILPHLAPSQIKDEVFDIVDKYATINDYSIFYENVTPNLRRCLAPIFNIADSKFFTGRLVSFSLQSSPFLLKAYKHVEPILYLYDIPWLRGNTDFMENNRILRNPNMKLVTRSTDYAKAVKNYTGILPEVKTLEQIMTEVY